MEETVGEIQIGHWVKFGSAIREARRTQSLSQSELAARAGVSRSWLARLEAGHRGAEFEQILRTVSALGFALNLRDDGPQGGGIPKVADREELVADHGGADARLREAHEASRATRRSVWANASTTAEQFDHD